MQPTQPRFELLQDEEIILEDEQAVITNKRLIGNFGTAKESEFDAYELAEVGAPNKFNGGQYGRRAVGFRLLVGGSLVVLAGAVLQPILQPDYRIEALVFVAGAIGAMVGLYILLNDLFRPPPNTTVIFPVFGGKDIIVSYPEWDNPKAEEMVRSFARVKRGMAR